MLYHIEQEASNHTVGLKLALKSCEGTEPDLLIITEDGSKVFTQSIILSLYSKVFSDILAEHKAREIPSVLLSTPSVTPVLNLLKILTDGIVLSTDSKDLLEVEKVAQLLDIKLDGLQLGSRKTLTAVGKNKTMKAVTKGDLDEHDRRMDEVPSVLVELQVVGTAEISDLVQREIDIKSEVDVIINYGDEYSEETGNVGENGKSAIVKGQKHCTECGKKFTTKQTLERHMMIHTGERPFKCGQCGRGFTNVFSMKQHSITHIEDKPFACHCGAKFTQKSSLKRHQEKQFH